MYQVLNWDRHFEGAKSKTYNNKTSCSMPCKHGLGYRRLIRSKNGPALFGAWCALIQVLSRHEKPRQGYCTDTGRIDGISYTSEDLEFITDIPARIFDEMFLVCKSHHVGWVRFIKDKDTAGIQQGTIVPLNLDLDSDSNLDSIYPDKSGKRKNLYSTDFESWWSKCGKGSKANAYKRWEEKRKSGELPDAEQLASIYNQYLEYCRINDRSIKDSEGWISGKFWETDWSIKNEIKLNLSDQSKRNPTQNELLGI